MTEDTCSDAPVSKNPSYVYGQERYQTGIGPYQAFRVLSYADIGSFHAKANILKMTDDLLRVTEGPQEPIQVNGGPTQVGRRLSLVERRLLQTDGGPSQAGGRPFQTGRGSCRTPDGVQRPAEGPSN